MNEDSMLIANQELGYSGGGLGSNAGVIPSPPEILSLSKIDHVNDTSKLHNSTLSGINQRIGGGILGSSSNQTSQNYFNPELSRHRGPIHDSTILNECHVEETTHSSRALSSKRDSRNGVKQ